MDNITLTDFLPLYPSIDNDFNSSIQKKKEFYDLKLTKTESKPKSPGTLMKSQEIIARFISSHTPYDGILLYHEMGTGKTCSALGAAERIVRDKNNSFNKICSIGKRYRYIKKYI